MAERYCPKCDEWVQTGENRDCPQCGGPTFKARRVTDLEEVKRYFSVREGHKDKEKELLQMLADTGAIIEVRS